MILKCFTNMQKISQHANFLKHRRCYEASNTSMDHFMLTGLSRVLRFCEIPLKIFYEPMYVIDQQFANMFKFDKNIEGRNF